MSSKTKSGTSVETELAELQRRYKLMEQDRKTYAEESQSVIRKQRSALEKLRKDNDSLKEELEKHSRGSSLLTSLEANNKIAKLNDNVDALQRKIELEKRKNDELDRQIATSTKQLAESRAKKGGINSTFENNTLIQKQVKVLENRLDKALVKFNEALAFNKQLRETIDNLRRERVVFDGIYKKLEKELHDKKKEMASIIEISNIAYEERDQAQSDLVLLQKEREAHEREFQKQIESLDELLESSRKMMDSFKLREKERKDREILGDLSLDEEAKLKKKTIKGNWAITHSKMLQQANAEKVQSYEEAFEKIREATGISDIDELVEKFITSEDQNFSLFNYVNELNNEIERLEEQIVELQAEIEKFKGQGANVDQQRKRVLRELEDKLTQTEARAEEYEAKFEKTMRIVEGLRGGIQSIFTKAGCIVTELLGNTGVTENNMTQYLGMVEQRINELLSIYLERNPEALHSSSSAAGSRSGKELLPVGTGFVPPVPPTTGEDLDGEDDDEDEDDDRPLTREQILAKAAKMANKREKKPAVAAASSKPGQPSGKPKKIGKK